MRFPEETEIKKLRKNLDITQSELAAMSGVSQSTIAKMERGVIKGSYDAVTKIFTVLEQEMDRRRQGLRAKDVMTSDVVSVQLGQNIRQASDIMRASGYSQLPVFDGKRAVGSISEYDILNRLREGEKMDDLGARSVGSMMDDPYPVVTEETPVEALTSLLSTTDAVLVSKKGDIVGILTRSDVLKLITAENQ
ncbi:MAG: Zinc metalloprotease [Methanomassiliicoccales archaeon PtaU1.Bin124]|nr:MAG: Zinc metalloprotease [Methanomassiliicoccales archaeon PtaU1.Bin124]